MKITLDEAMKSMATGYLVPRTCPVCGKVFFVRNPKNYVYTSQVKIEGRKIKTFFCGYNCKNYYEKHKEE